MRGYDSGTILTILGTLVTPPHAPRLFAPPGVLVLFALISVLPATVWAQDEGRPDLPTPDQLNVQVIPVSESIRVDGILDEAVWQHAVPATRFWQYAPLDRVPATENTEVRVVQDDRALYFGIMCHDANPKGIIALDMRRDAPLSNVPISIG